MSKSTTLPESPAVLVPAEHVDRCILHLRGQRVILDADLAELYGVSTRRLNEQLRRNRERFPHDFLFKLTKDEKDEVVAKCDHLEKLKFSPALPHAFTEHGAIMAANVLKSPRAAEVSVQVVRTFVRLRQVVTSNRELARQLEELERRVDVRFRAVFDAIRELMAPPAPARRRIGCHRRRLEDGS